MVYHPKIKFAQRIAVGYLLLSVLVLFGDAKRYAGENEKAKERHKRFCEEDLPPPEGLKIQQVESTKAVIAWDIVEEAERYLLSIQPTTECSTGEENVTTNFATYTNLDSGTDYVVSVSSSGSQGDACSSEVELEFRTADGDWTCDDNVELGLIEILEAPDENLTTTSVFITWNAAENALSYDLQLDPPNFGSLGLGEEPEISRTLHGLESGLNYIATVTPIRKGRLGKPSSISFVTKLSPPQQFRVANASSTYFKAEWEPDAYALKYTVTLYQLDEYKNETYVNEKTTTENEQYFRGLEAVTQYRVSIVGSNDDAFSMVVSRDFYTKLPTPKNVTLTNVTSNSVFASWLPVEGAILYKVVLILHMEGTTALVRTVKEPEVFLTDLDDATEYKLDIYAMNNYTDSLPGRADLYTRLIPVKLLNIDLDYIQDTSLVVRWDIVAAANWYKVAIDPPTRGAKGIGNVETRYTRITNLLPGTMYKITVISMNSDYFDTKSTPESIYQATQLPRPKNLTASYIDVKHDSMRLTWDPVPATDVYFLFAYDCSKRGSTVDPLAPRSTMGPTTQPAAYESKMKYWNYNYAKRKKVKLQCESVYVDVSQAIREAKEKNPSNVLGQGRINGTEVLLTNLYPATKYEIVLVAGNNVKQSEAAILLQHTKLPDPENFAIDPDMIESGSVFLAWDPVDNASYYQFEIQKTVAVKELNKFKPKAKRQRVHVRQMNFMAGHTFESVRPLNPTTNYSFILTAMNEHTWSFPVEVNTFTRLPTPSTLNIVPEDLTTDQILVQWADVEDAQYYNVSYAVTNNLNKDEAKVWTKLNVTQPEIFLKNLTANTLYEINIRASNVFTESLPAVADTYTKLPTPNDFSVVKLEDTIIGLGWSTVEGCKDYKLGISKYPTRPERFQKDTRDTHITYEMLSPNRAYIILMKATNPNTESDVLEIVQYTKLPKPKQLTFVDIGDKMLRLRWRSVPESNIYTIEVFALFNESAQNDVPPFEKDKIVTEINMDDGEPLVSKSRRKNKREANDEYSGLERDKRAASKDDSNAVQSISFKTKKGGKSGQSVYISPDGVYYINITETDISLMQLEPGVKYTTIVRAKNRNTDSLPVSLSAFTKLERPQSLAKQEDSVTNETMTVRWREVKKATYYRVEITSERKKRMMASAVMMADGITTDKQINFKGLKPNVNYTVAVYAGNNHIESYAAVMWEITKLSPPEELKVLKTSVTSSSFRVRWDPIEHAQRYVILINPPMVNGRNKLYIHASETKVLLDKLEDTKKYKITVSAENDRIDGVVKSFTQYTKLLTPKNVEIVQNRTTATSITLRWSPVKSADEYRLELSNGTDILKTRSPKDPVVEYTFNKLKSGHKYWVTIRAHNWKHKTFSDYIQVGTFTKLETPQGFDVVLPEVTDTSFMLAWQPVPLAFEYEVISVIEPRDGDHFSIHLHVDEEIMYIKETTIDIDGLRPASYYYVKMRAMNQDTESDTVDLHVFTKLPEPSNVSLIEHFYMDVEAELDWLPVRRAEFYRVEVFAKPNTPENHTETEPYTFDDAYEDLFHDNGSIRGINESGLVYDNDIGKSPYHTVIGLQPLTEYVATVSAYNKDTNSDRATMEFKTKSACEDDFHLFPSTNLVQALYRKVETNQTVEECLILCCEEREFRCRSVSIEKQSRDCYLFDQDRNTAPPLGLSKYYDHYERKFWREVSGFQIRSLTHNNIAVMNVTVEITLTFVYVGKTGCVEWDLGEGTKRYHAILDTDCSFMCENAPPGTNCTILKANPIENSNQIKTSHVYDMNSVYDVRANVSDQGTYEVSTFKIAINEKGCIYPQITIEEDAKNMKDPKELFRSSKLVLSTTPTIVCNSFPGVKFEWKAVAYAVSSNTVTNSFRLNSFGSEMLVPALTFELGLYRISAKLELLDEEHDLTHSDSIYIHVIPSPLAAKIKGGGMRTVGYNRTVTWDASTKSFDPDTTGPDRQDLTYTWFCRNYTDDKFEPLESGSCFPDLSALTFDGPGKFSLNTTLMHLYVEYEFQVIVGKGERTTPFKQQVVVKEGDPPEFYVECKENCKAKMNPTQALALNAVCLNCKSQRNPKFEWTLYEVTELTEDETLKGTGAPLDVEATFEEEEDIEDVDYDSVKTTTTDEGKIQLEKLSPVLDWELNTTTGAYEDILVMIKNSLETGKKYTLRLNVSMDGLDDRVYSYSDLTFITNIPPYGGICSTESSVGNCIKFKSFPNTQVLEVEPGKTYGNTTEAQCSQNCCFMREFLCLSYVYNRRHKTCALLSEGKDSLFQRMTFSKWQDFYQRVFYIGGAVVDEIFLECRDWKDEGDLMTHPKPGERTPKTTLTYKYTALPYGNRTTPLLLYFGTVLKTPGISMALGDPDDDYAVSIKVQICDMYGECAMSNTITLEIIPPDTSNVGDTLSGFTNGSDSKLAIFSSTGNSKAAAQLVQSIASIINMNDEEEDRTLARNRSANGTGMDATTPWLVTTASPTTAQYTTMNPAWNNSGNGTQGVIAKDLKQNLRKDVVEALSSASDAMTSIDNLKQMTSAMNSITQKPEEISKDAQMQASNTVLKMAESLTTFSEESNKEDVANAAQNIIGSLGSVAKSSETDMTDLKEQMLQPSEINFNTLDEADQSPDEFEFYNKIKLKQEKRRVRRSALDSEGVMDTAINAIEGTAGSLLDKQMSGEPPIDLDGERMEMQVQKTSPSDIGKSDLSTGRGTSLKLPGADSLFGKNGTNMTNSVDLQVMAFDDNPLGFGDDAAFINSPVTMLKIGGMENNTSGNDTEDNDNDKPGVGISIPSKFNPIDDMMTIERDLNDTGLSISKFEMVSQNNAILLLVEPEDERTKFDVYLRFHAKPSEEEYDFKFSLPHDVWDVTIPEDRFKIFIPEKDVTKIGMIFVGIQDNLNASHPRPRHRGMLRRRRSIGIVNSTTYHILIATPGCRRFDSAKKKWTGDGCKVSEHSTPETTECFCNKLSPTSMFSAEFFVPPNTINFATVFAKIDIADNPAVFSTVICLIAVYILLLIWTHRRDKQDKIKWSLKSILDNRKEDKYLYQVTVFTGHGREAATHSNVYCILFGEEGRTKVRHLRIKENSNPFTRSSVNHFLLRTEKCLGNLTHVHVWHDNSGKGGYRGWYLDQVAVQDVMLGDRFYFICDQWLAVDQDDGLVDRILPVASPENMSTFHRLFISTTSQKFTEDHLWISVFYRPTKSTFTRVQRLSCCACLLFMTMIANAMWFESGKRSGSGGTTTLTVGPFTVSPIQLWTSFCSTLMVVPIVTLVITLFKKAKTKEQEEYDKKEKIRKERALKRIKKRQHEQANTLPNPSDLFGKDAVYTIGEDGRIQAQGKRRISSATPQNTWPHWCVYIAWTLVVLGILCSGFFAILYSFEWGRVKANRWLSNMMLSFWQSVLIVQPIKVIILSMFVAAIVKKPDEQAMDSVHDKDVDEAEKNFMNLCADNIEAEMQEKENIAPPKPPGKKRLRRARRLRAKERAMSEVIWEVIVYFFYVMVLLFLCHGNRDSKGFHITNAIKRTFVNPFYGLQSVSSVEYFWRFMNKTLLPNLYPVSWYNGKRKNWRDRSFLVDEQSYRVGPARLRQIRVDPSECPPGAPGPEECRSGFSWLSNDEEDYAPTWIPLSEIEPSKRPESDPDDPLDMAWKYRSWVELKGMPSIGEITAYPGGGYSAELGVNYASGQEILNSLYRDAWVDHRTRAVFTEFTVYNPNVNLFTTVNFISEFPPVGAAVYFVNIVTFRLYHYIGSFGTLVVFAQAIFVIHLLYATYKTIKKLVQMRKKFFFDPWNIFEGIILFLDWTIVGLTALRIILTNQTIDAFHENKRKYVNFQQVTSVDSLVGYVLAISAFMGILRFMKLLRFNKRIGMMSSVLKYSAKQWPGFFVLAMVFFVAFIHIGYIVFSPFLENFKNLVTAAETMVDTMMGSHTYPLLRDTYRFFGPIYYFVFCFTSTFIIMNILIAIIGESHKATHQDLENSNNQYEIIDFMMKRFVKWSGLDRFKSGKDDKKRTDEPPRGSPSGDMAAVEEASSPLPENQLVKFQKQLDEYAVDLENKYKKLLSHDELRDEVVTQMKLAQQERERQLRIRGRHRQPAQSRSRPSVYEQPGTSRIQTVSSAVNNTASLFAARRY